MQYKKETPPRYFMNNKIARFCLFTLDLIFSLLIRNKKKEIPIPKKILLCHPAHLGDVILLTSLLKPLKENFPEIQIGVVVSSASKVVVEGHPNIDWVHTFDHFKLRGKNISANGKKDIKKIGYDTVICCNFHYPNLAPLFWRLKIPVRIGFTSAGFSPFLTHKLPWVNINQSVAEFHLQLLKMLPHFHWEKPLKPSIHLPQTISLFSKQSYIVFHMGSNNSIKEWPLDKWKELAYALKDEKVVFTGKGSREKKNIEAVIQPNHVDLCDKLSWQELVSLVKNAKELVSVDTSVAHIAAAFDIPTKVLFTGIYPTMLWKPLSDKVVRVSASVNCSPCFNGKGCKSMACIKNISFPSEGQTGD